MAKREKYTTGKDGYKRYQITYVDAVGCTCRKRLTARTDREMDEKIKQFNRSTLQYSCLGNPIDRGARSATVPEHSTAEPFYNKHLSSTKHPPWEDVYFPK